MKDYTFVMWMRGAHLGPRATWSTGYMGMGFIVRHRTKYAYKSARAHALRAVWKYLQLWNRCAPGVFHASFHHAQPAACLHTSAIQTESALRFITLHTGDKALSLAEQLSENEGVQLQTIEALSTAR